LLLIQNISRNNDCQLIGDILQSKGEKTFNMDVYMKFSLVLMLLLSVPGWAAKWSVTTYNIRNFDKDTSAGPTDLQELSRIIQDVKADVMAFEEVVNTEAFAALIKKNLPGYAYELSECGGFGKQRLAIVYNPKTFELIEKSEDMTFSGRDTGCGSLRPVLLVTLREKDSKIDYTFGAVHLKAGGNDRAFKQRWQQYLKLEKLSSFYQKNNLILLGDFNTTGYNIKDQDYVKFEDFIGSAGLRTLSEEIGCTNYWHGTSGGVEYQSSILDHVVIQDKNLNKVEKVEVGSHCARTACRPAKPEALGLSFKSVSDHCPVKVTFN
jgi:endonuclease/exonuclease/phosphatase family metal-dependent hydrolase